MTDTFLTTAISYPNGLPHIGHLYESVLADFYKRAIALLPGHNRPYLQTGTDEHGKKIEQAAAAAGVTPAALCETNSAAFVELNKQLETDYDAFFRTSTLKHALTVQLVIAKLIECGCIYLGTYVGWYCVREETFYSEHDAAATSYKDPVTGAPLERIEEPSYFFRMEPYRTQILEWLDTNPISPAGAATTILARLEKPLQDLSISRTGFTWGIKMPTDSTHIVYVWFDALLNYITGYTRGTPVHIIGTDIVWFHAVIYPAILLAADLPLPGRILVHGFVTDSEGRKMSKSIGNVVSVDEALTVGLLPLRYHLLMVPLGYNVQFNAEVAAQQFKTELVANFGNLVQRSVGLYKRICGTALVADSKVASEAVVPPWTEKSTWLAEFANDFNPRTWINGIMFRSTRLNKWINDVLLTMKDDKTAAVADLLTAVRELTIYFEPIVPERSKYICSVLDGELLPHTGFKVF